MAAPQASSENEDQQGNPLVADTTRPTPSNSTTACEKVFSTVELLDMILMNVLSLYTLHNNSYDNIQWMQSTHILLLQRLNNTFYNHINGDTEVACALHLIPFSRPSKTVLAIPQRVSALARYPTLAEVMPHWREIGSDNSCLKIYLSRQQLEQQYQSWSKLLLYQPPIMKLWMRPTLARWAYRPDPAVKAVLVSCDSGLTVGIVFDAGNALLSNPGLSYGGVEFRVQIDWKGNEVQYVDEKIYW